MDLFGWIYRIGVASADPARLLQAALVPASAAFAGGASLLLTARSDAVLRSVLAGSALASICSAISSQAREDIIGYLRRTPRQRVPLAW